MQWITPQTILWGNDKCIEYTISREFPEYAALGDLELLPLQGKRESYMFSADMWIQKIETAL